VEAAEPLINTLEFVQETQVDLAEELGTQIITLVPEPLEVTAQEHQDKVTEADKLATTEVGVAEVTLDTVTEVMALTTVALAVMAFHLQVTLTQVAEVAEVITVQAAVAVLVVVVMEMAVADQVVSHNQTLLITVVAEELAVAKVVRLTTVVMVIVALSFFPMRFNNHVLSDYSRNFG
jgi:hypothetical protein